MKGFSKLENYLMSALMVIVTIAYVSTAFYRAETIKSVNQSAIADIDYPEKAR